LSAELSTSLFFLYYFQTSKKLSFFIKKIIEKTEIEFRAEKLPSVIIWRKLNNTKSKKLLPFSQLSEVESNELNFIKKAFEEQSNILGLTTRHNSIRKTKIGYTFVRQCKRKDCRATAILQINVRNGMGTILIEETCKQHFISEKNGVEFKAEKPLSAKIWHQLKNNKKCLPPLSKLSKIESKELNSIKKAFEEQLNELGLRTRHDTIRKTETGYTLYRRCKQKECVSPVYLKINVTNGMGKMFFAEKCKHH